MFGCHVWSGTTNLSDAYAAERGLLVRRPKCLEKMMPPLVFIPTLTGHPNLNGSPQANGFASNGCMKCSRSSTCSCFFTSLVLLIIRSWSGSHDQGMSTWCSYSIFIFTVPFSFFTVPSEHQLQRRDRYRCSCSNRWARRSCKKACIHICLLSSFFVPHNMW